MMKNIIAAVVLVALGAIGALAFMNSKKEASSGVACTMEAMQCPDGSYVGRQGPNCEFAACLSAQAAAQNYKWTFKGKGEEAGTGAPLTEVSLTYGNTTKVIGTYQGSCSVIEGSAWTLLSGEKSGVICWFAGGGSEIGIFEEGGKMVVKVGGVEEGDAETAGSRGGFKTVMSL